MRKILALIFFIALIYCLYATISYTIIGFASPTIYSDEVKGFLVGNFYLALVFGICSIIFGVLFIIFYRKRRKKLKV